MQQILILLLLLTSLSNSKDLDFSIVVKKPFNDALFDITQDYDGRLSAVGFSQNYKQNSNHEEDTYTDAFEYLESLSKASGHQMHLLKVDNQASINIDKQLKLSNFSEAVAVVKTVDNGYFVGGHSSEGSLVILKLDSNANVIYKKTFGTKNYDRMNNLISLSDGGVLAIGSSITTRSQSDNMYRTGLGLNDMFITRFSKTGQMLWSRKYGTPFDDRGVDAVEAVDGTIVVMGMTRYKTNKDLTIMRISENGEMIWLKHYKSSVDTTPHKIIRLRDTNFLLSISQKDDMNMEQIRLIKFDLQKNILIDKIIHTLYSSVIKDIEEFSDGAIVAVGYIQDSLNRDALAMIFDSNIDMLHQEHYGEQNYDQFNAVTILRNSQVAAAGIYTFKGSQSSNMWIMKLNRDLTMAKYSAKIGSSKIFATDRKNPAITSKSPFDSSKTDSSSSNSTSSSLNLYEKLLILFAPEIKLKQLIIKKDLSILFMDKRLYFQLSKFILTPTQKIFLDRFSKKLIPFLNRYKNHIATLEINGHTSSEWGAVNFKPRYLNNAKLSMNRSYSTLSYIFETQILTNQKWLSKILKGTGLSYSKKVSFNNKENKEKSRRVSFKIYLK